MPSRYIPHACGPEEAVFPCRMQRVQYRALTCLHNVLSTMDVESLGGAEALQGVAQHLSSLVFSPPGEPFFTIGHKNLDWTCWDTLHDIGERVGLEWS